MTQITLDNGSSLVTLDSNGEEAVGDDADVVLGALVDDGVGGTAADLAIYSALTEGDLQFIEIYNPTMSAVNLTEWRIRKEIDFDFAPGTMLDPDEAIAIISFNPDTTNGAGELVNADRIVVMESGNVVQIGTAQEIYAKPANRFVADFIGTMNFMPAEVVEVLPDDAGVHVRTEFSDKMLCKASDTTATTPGKKVYASIRPEDVEIFTESPQTRQNLFKGTIAHRAYLGNFLYFFIRVNDTMIRVQVPHHVPQEEGQELHLYLNPQKCMILL